MLIWYVAYGSNLMRARFLTYLKGGPVPGRINCLQHGARDASDPLEDRPYALDQLRLVFGRSSPGWGDAGVAFVVPSSNARDETGTTHGRAWLITTEQFSDVWAQENGGTVGPKLDMDALVKNGSADLGRPGWYPKVVYLGSMDGNPVATLTCDVLSPNLLNAGSPMYLEIMGRGLMETCALSSTEAAEYLVNQDGNRNAVCCDTLVSRLQAPNDLAR